MRGRVWYLLLLLALLAPWFTSDYIQHLILLIFFWTYLGTAWNILGGYAGPSFLPGAIWLLLKTLLLFAVVLWVRWSFLRLRIDQALHLNWKVLFPISLLNLLIAAYWVVSRGGGP